MLRVFKTQKNYSNEMFSKHPKQMFKLMDEKNIYKFALKSIASIVDIRSLNLIYLIQAIDKKECKIKNEFSYFSPEQILWVLQRTRWVS